MKEKDWALSRSALLFFWKRDGEKLGSAAVFRPLNMKITTHTHTYIYTHIYIYKYK